MAKPESSNPNDRSSRTALKTKPDWIVAASCLVLGMLLAVAVLSYNPDQTGFITTNPVGKNFVGWAGATASFAGLFAIGVGTYLIPIFLFWLSYLAVRHPRQLTLSRILAMLLAILTASALVAMIESFRSTNEFPHGLGGYIGERLYHGMFQGLVGDFGSVVILGVVYLSCLLFIFTKDIGAEVEEIASRVSAWWAGLTAPRPKAAAAAPRSAPEPSKAAPAPLVLEPVGPANKNVFVAKSGGTNAPQKPPEEGIFRPEPEAAPKTQAKSPPATLNIVKPAEPRKVKALVPQAANKDYKFPPVSLLKEQVRPSAASSEEEHRQNAENLLRILGEFGVDVALGEIHVGPVITRYELVPAPGVRVEKISGLDKNIALGMRAQSVRILAPIPGKAAVGVEVPNQHPTPVGLREILESEDWSTVKADLPIALGKDVSGKPLISDLCKMPHLLIAGATGSGKSICVNSIVSSIAYSKSPDDVRFIMVDPKVVELKIFNTLPHMLIPVVTEPKKVPAALKWLLSEMEKRYQIFAKVNVRNISGFNHRKRGAVADPAQPTLEGLEPAPVDDGIDIPDRLPYIVIIIDELADLMMIAPAEIETNIARLAQLARAAGIHVIIATQRPSVDVITGVIKANLPARIAFQVASQVDSRTIIDTKGADMLIGRGDMLFTPPGTSRIVRAQGAFVSDEEVQAIVEFLKVNGPPQYQQSVQQHIDSAANEDDDGDGADGDGDLGDDEELLRQALDVLRTTRRASTSMLQRRLRIGYNRAARVMEIMEDKGYVGPENGSSPREILVDLDNLSP
jgi:DNA segregation ATPase FtsK/SpoIIIE, S-DNA-T family